MWYQFRQFLRFYWAAQTKYQVHSPFVTAFIAEVLEDDRWFYAFSGVERLRRKMLAGNTVIAVTDFGAGSHGAQPAQGTMTPLRQIVRRAASRPEQGRRLFRLAAWQKPNILLELGASTGIATTYLAHAVRRGHLYALEGCPQTVGILQANLAALDTRNVTVVTGNFDHTLAPLLARLEYPLDLVYFDGNHRREPTLRYFEACLPHVGPNSVFIFDDIHWSAEMDEAWSAIRQHPRATLTIDCFDLSFVFFNPDFKEKQHFRLVPFWQKPWRIF
jgi:predicted O-methyltransferase YrrM